MEQKWIAGFAAAILITNILGFGWLNSRLSRFVSNVPVSAITAHDPDASKYEAILEEIRSELAVIRNSTAPSDVQGTNIINIDDYLSTITSISPAPPQATSSKVSISNPAYKTLNVYKERLFSSPVVGRMEYGQKYPYLVQENGWFQISLPDNITGWVLAQYVNE